jgi:pSer/pThr/pTyr-binding forkhead associated (FHA) protein
MAAYLEVWTPTGRELVALEAGRLTLGTDQANDLALPADPTLSRLHAVLERYEAGWCVRDLDSRNGTFVNGQDIHGRTRLEPGDQLQLGVTLVELRSATQIAERPSAGAREPRPASRRRS